MKERLDGGLRYGRSSLLRDFGNALVIAGAFPVLCRQRHPWSLIIKDEAVDPEAS